MKRDMELIRDILLAVEAEPAGQSVTALPDVQCTPVTLSEHIWLLNQGGLIEASFPGGSPNLGLFAIERLTPAGRRVNLRDESKDESPSGR